MQLALEQLNLKEKGVDSPASPAAADGGTE